MAQHQLHGSGGHIMAEITDETAKKADLGVGRMFLAPIGKLEESCMRGHFCKECGKEFAGPTGIRPEEGAGEQVADNLILVERGQYTCKECGSVIGEYRVFKKTDESGEAGMAKPSA